MESVEKWKIEIYHFTTLPTSYYYRGTYYLKKIFIFYFFTMDDGRWTEDDERWTEDERRTAPKAGFLLLHKAHTHYCCIKHKHTSKKINKKKVLYKDGVKLNIKPTEKKKGRN